ncbi:hypothetical protein H4R34_002794 [Dimargaris verticillata]|uniref:Uncharacterized protein n=1 Tax=Dimargaris verticillata TaxID=2761393 RepID=A0A9W8B5V5_9FUNG|nr:hypothetical protein H4R34_002794 [Dimargaris verticillata]
MDSPPSSRAAGKQPAIASSSKPTAQGSAQPSQATAVNASSTEPFIQRLATSVKSLASATTTWLPSDAKALRAATLSEGKGQAIPGSLQTSREPTSTTSAIFSENQGLSGHYDALPTDQPSASNVFRTATSSALAQPASDSFDFLTTPQNAATPLPHSLAERTLPLPSTLHHPRPLSSSRMHHHEACQDIMHLLHHSSSTGLMDAVYMPDQGEAERRHTAQQTALIPLGDPTRINRSIHAVLLDPAMDGLVHQYLSQSLSYTDDVYGPSVVGQDRQLRTGASSTRAAAPIISENSTMEQAWDQHTTLSQPRQTAVQRLLMFQKHLKPRL